MNLVPQEGYGILQKFTPFQVKHQAVVLEKLKDLMKNWKMLLLGGGGSQVVIQVQEDTGLVGEGAVHQLLEGL